MLEIIIKTFWLLLPAGIANMSPVLFKWINFLNIPISKNLFGKNKTYRGFFFGILMAILVVYLQQMFYSQTQTMALIDYSTINVVLLGFLLGFGALFGDLAKSYFKRKVGIKPGESWFPFDQIDWIVGALVFLIIYISISWEYIIASVLLFGILHLIMNLIGYYLRIKKRRF